MSIPRDLKVAIPGHGDRQDQRRLRRSAARSSTRQDGPASCCSIPINHVVNVNFGGFRRAVNRLGCVYVDIDRHYFNDNNPPVGGGGDYATINIQAGYQKLCGQDALDYVRYRHFDTDLVRAARQQDFLRQAKDQIGVGKIFGDRKELLKIFARYTQTDIRGEPAILRLLKLRVRVGRATRSRRSTSRRTRTGDVRHGVAARRWRGSRARVPQRQGLERPARRGARSRAPTEAQAPHSKRRSRAPAPGCLDAKTQRRGPRRSALATPASAFPVYYPKLPALGSAATTTRDRRAYTITDRGRHTLPRLPHRRSDGRASASTTASRARPGRRRRSSTTRRETRRIGGRELRAVLRRRAACAWSPGRRSGPSTGSRTRCCRRSTNKQMLGDLRASR